MEYRTLKERSGISDFILEAICVDFLDKYDRFPYLDEIIGSNSEPYVRKTLQLDGHNSTNIDNILSTTGASTIEQANISLNDQYRDVEVEIIPLNKDAIVEITKRPTEDNFDNWTEEDEILARAPRNAEGQLLAPNGKVSNLTEKQYAQVRTKTFKRWFGDWEKVNTFNIDAIDTSKVDIEEHDKSWKNNPTKSNKTLRIYIKGQHEKGYFELVKDHEFGMFSVHFKTGNANTGETYGSTKEERNILYKQILNALPNGAQLSTWGELSKGGIEALNKLGKNLKKVGERQVKDRQGNSISIPIYQKGEGVSKVVDENGEPLVVYHGQVSKLNEFHPNTPNRFDKTAANGLKKMFYATPSVSHANQFSLDDNILLKQEIQKYLVEADATLKEASELFNKTEEEIEYILNTPNTTGKVYAVFLNIKNPIEINAKSKALYKLDKEEINAINNSEGAIITNVFESLNPKYLEGLSFGDDILSNPFTTDYIVSNPNQIKSATDNSGLFNRQNNNIYDPEPNGYLIFTQALNKLASLYGIKFNDITDAELNSEKWKSIIPDVNSVNAFVYNGQIYINIDKANLDAPIHEMMHILVGSIRFQNPNLYTELINLAQQFPNYSKLIQKFPGRTRNDVNEEVFIEEVSRYLSGLPSNIASITPKLQYEISYNVKRLLDTILMGQDSVKTLTNDRLFSLSLKELAQQVNSSIMKNNFHGTINVENSELHRKLNNIKSDLYNQGTLKEYCD